MSVKMLARLGTTKDVRQKLLKRHGRLRDIACGYASLIISRDMMIAVRPENAPHGGIARRN
jgi:hypothetical protein